MTDTHDFYLPPQYVPIGYAVNELIAATQAGLTHTYADKEKLEAAYAQLMQVSIITEDDRHWFLIGLLSLQSSYVECLPEDQRGNAMADLQNTAVAFSILCPEDAPYKKLRDIIKNLAMAIRSGEEITAATQEALNAIDMLRPALGNDTLDLINKARIRVYALQQTVDWIYNRAAYENSGNEILEEFRSLGTHLETHGFDHLRILQCFNFLRDRQASTPAPIESYTLFLLLVFGLALLHYPDAAPCLKELEMAIVNAANALPSTVATNAPDEENQSLQQRIDNIISNLISQIQLNGFSQYALETALVDWKKIQITSEEEYAVFQQGMVRLFDVGIDYGTEEAKAVFRVCKECHIENISFLETHPEPLSFDELMSHGYALVHDLKQNLAKGEQPEAAITRAMQKIQYMAMHVEYDDDAPGDELKEFFSLIMNKLLKAMDGYIPEERQAMWKEANKLMSVIPEAVDLADVEGAEKTIQSQALENDLMRMMQFPVDVQDLENAKQTALVQQFLDLFGTLSMRFLDSEEDYLPYDRKAFLKLKEELDDTMRLMSSSYTIHQFIEHQKMSLRRMAIELSRFERRRHMMLAQPIFPAHPVVRDPNRIFYSGGKDVLKVLQWAVHELGMTLSTQRSVTTLLHSRWNQLRESALAVFDYTAYDPTLGDAQVVYPQGSDEEVQLLLSAASTAAVAYENGWAYALGTPHVVVCDGNKPMPFDIDLAPVRLSNDDNDTVRLMHAIQVSLYGVNRNTTGSCIDKTAAFIKKAYGTVQDEEVEALLQSLDDTRDATRVLYSAESLLERMQTENHLLITPAFPGGYPAPGVGKVFHITAFRAWSKPLEMLLKKQCAEHEMEYIIGYEQLNPDILPDIWIRISEATHVVADITNLNPNALLELAMAQALGRPVLILTQNPALHQYIPILQKLRFHTYTPGQNDVELQELIAAFFAES